MDAIDRNFFAAQASDYPEAAVLARHEDADGNRYTAEMRMVRRDERPVAR